MKASLVCAVLLALLLSLEPSVAEDDDDEQLATGYPNVPMKVLKLDPSKGYTVGDDIITVIGENFPNIGDQDDDDDEEEDEDVAEEGDTTTKTEDTIQVFCMFGTVAVDAEEVYPTYITCKTPSHPEAGKVTVEIKIGTNITKDGLQFEYELPPPPVFVDFIPKDGVSFYGGELITITGENFGTWDDRMFRCRFVSKDGMIVPAEVTDIEESEISCVVPEFKDPSITVYVEMSADEGKVWNRIPVGENKLLEFIDPCEEYESCRDCVLNHCGYCFHNNLCQTVAPNGLFRKDPDMCTLDKWVHVKGDCSRFEGAPSGPSARSKMLGIGALLACAGIGGIAYFISRRYKKSHPRDVDMRPLMSA